MLLLVPLKSFGLSTWWPLLTWKVKRSDIKYYTWCPYISRVTLAKGSQQEGKVFLEQETLFASRISKRAVLGIGFARNREIYHLAKKSLSLLILILQCCLFRTFGNQEDLWISWCPTKQSASKIWSWCWLFVFSSRKGLEISKFSLFGKCFCNQGGIKHWQKSQKGISKIDD